MPQKVGPIRRPDQQIYTKYRKVDTLNSAKLIELREIKLCKTSIRHERKLNKAGL